MWNKRRSVCMTAKKKPLWIYWTARPTSNQIKTCVRIARIKKCVSIFMTAKLINSHKYLYRNSLNVMVGAHRCTRTPETKAPRLKCMKQEMPIITQVNTFFLSSIYSQFACHTPTWSEVEGIKRKNIINFFKIFFSFVFTLDPFHS